VCLVTGVLVLCTANVCRSVMAESLLSGHLAALGAAVPVSSAGMLGAGEPPPAEVVSAMATRGGDVTRHRSQVATAGGVAQADLVLGMTREHLRHAAVLCAAAWPRTFTLRELVRRGRQVGPRAAGEPLAEWLARAGSGRNHLDLLGSDATDDLADPIGGPPQAYEATAALIDQLTADLAELCWGLAPGG
jgi:protein-tyrosine phosphatase